MMKATFLMALGVVAASAYSAEDVKSFTNFKAKFNKTYETEEEELLRFNNFLASQERARSANKAGGVTSFGITKFSDMSKEEFKSMLGFQPLSPDKRVEQLASIPTFQPHNVTAAPASVDWRNNGAVTAVKDQGQCGSCWAFSATEQIESQWFLAGNTLTEFAPQQIVSCDTTDGGCQGGDTPTAYQYVKSAGGLALNSAYPYTSGAHGVTGKCSKSFTVAGGNVSGYTYATPACTGSCTNQDETTLMNNVAATAPASICVDAEPWQEYTGGLFPAKGTSCQNAYNDLDHCVQLIGYNTDTTSLGAPYWIVRNSWAADWGEGGMIYVQMGSNLCGIADEATFVTIAK